MAATEQAAVRVLLKRIADETKARATNEQLASQATQILVRDIQSLKSQMQQQIHDVNTLTIAMGTVLERLKDLENKLKLS